MHKPIRVVSSVAGSAAGVLVVRFPRCLSAFCRFICVAKIRQAALKDHLPFDSCECFRVQALPEAS